MRRIRREGRPPVDMVAVADRVYRQRVSIGMTQDDLAAMASVSRAYISRLEHAGVPDPTMQDMMAVANALGFQTLDDMVYGPLSDDRQQALERLLRHRELAEAFSQVASAYENTPPADRGFLLEWLQLLARRRGLEDAQSEDLLKSRSPFVLDHGDEKP